MSEPPDASIRIAPEGQRAEGQDDKRHGPSKTRYWVPVAEDDVCEPPVVSGCMALEG